MTTHDLTDEQFDELRLSYFYSDDAQPKTTATGEDALAPWELADELIHSYYAGICFVSDDFACTAGRDDDTEQQKHLLEYCEKLLEIANNSDNPHLYEIAHEIKATVQILFLKDE